MRLIEISGKNIKGRTFKEVLAPITIFLGLNRAGKTARVDAIRLFFLGHLPRLGKTNEKTFKLASGREMAVSGVLSDGSAGERSWTSKGDSIQKKATGLFPPETSEGMIVLFDAKTYLDLSPAARVSYVYERVKLDPGAYSENQILSNLGEALSDRHAPDEDPTKEQKAAHDKLVGLITKAAEEAVSESGPQTPQQYVATALETAETFRKAAADWLKRMAGTTQGIAQIRAGEEQAVGASIFEIDDEKRTLAARLATLTSERAHKSAKIEAAAKTLRRREEINRSPTVLGVEDAKTKLAKDVARREFLKLELDFFANAKQALETALDTRNNANRAVDRLVDEVRNKKRAIDETEKSLAAIKDATTCPFCGASGEGWKALREAQLIGELAERRTALADAESSKTIFTKTLNDAGDAVGRRREELAKLEGFQEEARRLDVEIERTKSSINAANALKDELAGLVAEDDPQARADVEGMTTEIATINSKLKALDVARDAVGARQAAAALSAKAEQQARDAQAEQEIGKAALDFLKGTQAEMVDAAFAPILRVANDIFGAAAGFELAYKDGEIGYWAGGLWVSHEVFSGSEEAFSYAALAVALATAAPIKIAIIDELGRLDPDMAFKFALAVGNAMKRGLLDQFVGLAAGSSVPWIVALDPTLSVVTLVK